MLLHINPRDYNLETAKECACPEVATLMSALGDCQHPKAVRLLAQLCTNPHPSEEELEALCMDARHVLCLSFGAAEAKRRLSTLAHSGLALQ